MTPIQFDRLILHPGSPKTGTSGLQNFLFRKRDALRDLGYLYPMSGIDVESGTAKGHHAIALAIDPNASEPSEHLRAMLEALRAEIAAAPDKTVILSSEEFFHAQRMEVFKHYLQPASCQIYVSLRPQYEVMNANYYTQVTHNRIKNPPEAYFDSMKLGLKFPEIMTVFAQFTHNTDIKLRVFERGSPVRKSPIEDFLTVMGIELSYDPEDNIVEHPTLPAVATLFLRWLNDVGVSQTDFFEVFQDLHKMRPSLSKQTYTMSPDYMRTVVERFERDNIWLRQNFGDGASEPLFQTPEYPDAELWEQEVGRDLAAVQHKFLKQLCTMAESGKSR
ncbi:MAG: hypothetical protein KJ731_00290 [Alphaproteobacteria bacterium]|nr:hypothetical protein [Alphaproteobacteria bacterium]MBU1281696.1 hypothetical protein [Alphaproteobacteria bacterium]MBU1574371.1 hypothetical protein [Alphaproteobacteria bacterium]MBU1826914.1 hypothetical protein [Alphaproteobacteria bacterium]MBU2077170.1 hypothetical protein [Alphaproteobacteria bacterium]